MEDDVDVFPSVARIPDAMLQKVDPVNPVLVEYLTTIMPSIEAEKLLDASAEAKGDKVLKKKDHPLIVTELIIPEKEVVDMKYGVLKRLKKMAYSSHEKSISFSLKFHYKPQLTRKGVVSCEIPSHVSPKSKKRCAEDMAKHISTKQKKQKK
ncbi:unnamed protein product [Lactuca saligna]|uniref:Uncharacterized protein n=1 Tax=Lactuca saligna TaxID=75948 RepID=A0AA35YMK8_LACSI|nr:unnamed protein product [Lactuca saligna]